MVLWYFTVMCAVTSEYNYVNCMINCDIVSYSYFPQSSVTTYPVYTPIISANYMDIVHHNNPHYTSWTTQSVQCQESSCVANNGPVISLQCSYYLTCLTKHTSLYKPLCDISVQYRTTVSHVWVIINGYKHAACTVKYCTASALL